MSLDEDELEYYVTFPAPAPRSDFDWPRQEVKEPVIFLLGWLGAQDKILAKYSNLCEKLGCITIRYTLPSNMFHMTGEKEKIAERLLELLGDLCLEEHPVIFYVFSNHGAILYSHISAAARRLNRPISIQGCIFDSSPSSISLTSGMKVVQALMGGSWYGIVFSWLWALLASLSGLLNRIIGWPSIVHHPTLALKDEPSSWPQLFLYSKADEVINYKDVQQFIVDRRIRGVEVTECCWEDSPHVKHFLHHKDEYTAEVRGFLFKVAELHPERPEEAGGEGRQGDSESGDEDEVTTSSLGELAAGEGDEETGEEIMKDTCVQQEEEREEESGKGTVGGRVEDIRGGKVDVIMEKSVDGEIEKGRMEENSRKVEGSTEERGKGKVEDGMMEGSGEGKVKQGILEEKGEVRVEGRIQKGGEEKVEEMTEKSGEGKMEGWMEKSGGKVGGKMEESGKGIVEEGKIGENEGRVEFVSEAIERNKLVQENKELPDATSDKRETPLEVKTEANEATVGDIDSTGMKEKVPVSIRKEEIDTDEGEDKGGSN